MFDDDYTNKQRQIIRGEIIISKVSQVNDDDDDGISIGDIKNKKNKKDDDGNS